MFEIIPDIFGEKKRVFRQTTRDYFDDLEVSEKENLTDNNQMELEVYSTHDSDSAPPGETFMIRDANRGQHDDDVRYGYVLPVPSEDIAELNQYAELLERHEEDGYGQYLFAGNPSNAGALSVVYDGDEFEGEEIPVEVRLSKEPASGIGANIQDDDEISCLLYEEPTAIISGAPSEVEAGKTITVSAHLSDSGTYPIDEYRWETPSGEETTTNDPEVDLVIEESGKVQVEVVDNQGNKDADTANIDVTVDVAAAFTIQGEYTDGSGDYIVDQEFTLDASDSTQATQFDWSSTEINEVEGATGEQIAFTQTEAEEASITLTVDAPNATEPDDQTQTLTTVVPWWSTYVDDNGIVQNIRSAVNDWQSNNLDTSRLKQLLTSWGGEPMRDVVNNDSYNLQEVQTTNNLNRTISSRTLEPGETTTVTVEASYPDSDWVMESVSPTPNGLQVTDTDPIGTSAGLGDQVLGAWESENSVALEYEFSAPSDIDSDRTYTISNDRFDIPDDEITVEKDIFSFDYSATLSESAYFPTLSYSFRIENTSDASGTVPVELKRYYSTIESWEIQIDGGEARRIQSTINNPENGEWKLVIDGEVAATENVGTTITFPSGDH